jgi:hypothetical protein
VPPNARPWLLLRVSPTAGLGRGRPGLRSVSERSKDLAETCKGAIPPNSVGLITASDLNMLLGDGNRVGRPVEVVATPAGIDFASKFEVDDERSFSVKYQVAFMQVPVTHTKCMDRSNKTNNPQPYFSNLVRSGRAQPFIKWSASLQAAFVVIHPDN